MRLLTIAVLATALSGCLWDFEFFETYSEAGTPPAAMDLGGPPAADQGVAEDAEAPPLVSGAGPSCGALCPALLIDGGRVVALAPNDRRALWIVATGGPTQLRTGQAAQRVEGQGLSHLFRVDADTLAPQATVPLPFVATSAVAVGNSVFVAGTGAVPGVVGGQPFQPGERAAVLMKLVNDQPQWWLSWQGQAAWVARGPNAVWLVGGPGNAELYLNDGPEPVQPSAADPTAPTTFLADVDGAGAVRGFQPFGGPRTTVERVAGAGPLALAGLANGAFTTGDGVTVPDGRFLAVLGADLGVRWATAWPYQGGVQLSALAVDGAGEAWFAGRAAPGATLGPVPAQCGDGPFAARAQPDGTVAACAALTVDGATPQPAAAVLALAAPGARGAPAPLLLQSLGDADASTEFGGRDLPFVGLQLAAMEPTLQARWRQHLSAPSPNAPGPMQVAALGGKVFAAVEVHGSVAWGDTPVARQGPATTAVLGYSQ